MLGVFLEQRDLQRRLQLLRLLQIGQELHLRLGDALHRRQRPEDPFAAAVDAAGAGAAADERHAVALRHDALGLHELRAVAADDGVDFLLHDELLDELRALRAVGGVVEQAQVDLHLLLADLQAAGVVDFLDGQLGGRLEGAADLRLFPGERQDRADADDVLGGEGGGEEHDEGDCAENAHAKLLCGEV